MLNVGEHMKKCAVVLLLLLLVAAGLYSRWKPSAAGIAQEMEYNDDGGITHRRKTYRTDWGSTQQVEGLLRIKERHYDKNVPIVTYDLIVTSGEFSDPEVVEIESMGNGNFCWRSRDRRPEGSLVAYHTVPGSVEAQTKLDEANEGATIRLTGRISRNSQIKGDDGSFVKLMHANHKFILVEDVLTK